jgi:hypothetical protein
MFKISSQISISFIKVSFSFESYYIKGRKLDFESVASAYLGSLK